MVYFSGTADVGEDLVPLCPVPETGVTVRNNGGSVIYLGGPDLDGDGTGYPVDPGTTETVPGMKPKMSVQVPAPPGDMAIPVLYARGKAGAGISKVSFISVTP